MYQLASEINNYNITEICMPAFPYSVHVHIQFTPQSFRTEEVSDISENTDSQLLLCNKRNL